MNTPAILEANSIFQQPWWLDVVAQGNWSTIEIQRHGRIAARLPYVIKRRAGLTFITMPPLTQTLGPWIEHLDAKYSRVLAHEKSLYSEVIDSLPSFDLFQQRFHYSVTNWLPFYWKGFKQTTRYTYVIESLTDLERAWADLEGEVRNKIRKAQNQVSVCHGLDAERFYAVNSKTFSRQGLNTPYSLELVQRLDEACGRRGARRIFYAEDVRGQIHAALFLVWDANSAYYLMSGTDPEFRSSGALSLLLWEAIQFASTVTKKFDFEGSMIESVEQQFRAFGARQVPYFEISRMTPRMHVLNAAQEVARWAKRGGHA